MRESLKKILRGLGLHKIAVTIRNNWKNMRLRTGKVRIIRSYIERFQPQIFIETGTYRGDTLGKIKERVQKAYSIEVGNELYKKACERFAKEIKAGNLELFLGDSRAVLPKILAEVREPAIFWLDAHYSGAGTAKADIITPIEEELKLIFGHPIRKHIILIDDARDFIGEGDYPTPDTIQKLAESAGYSFEMKDNIFRLVPKK